MRILHGPAVVARDAALVVVVMDRAVEGRLRAADAAPGREMGAHRAYRAAPGRNADLKAALGMPKLLYPTYLHGAAKMFGAGEI